jgi:tetratricopeptide (TPR) repeat protein
MSSENNAKPEIPEESAGASKTESEMSDASSIASKIKDLHDVIGELINRQWKSLKNMVVLVTSAIVFVMGLAFLFLVVQGPEYGKHLAAMDKSAQQLQRLATALADSSTDCTSSPEQRKICEDAKAVIGKYAADYKKVSDDLVLDDQQLKPEAIALTQLIGGTAILALLGYLGLMRLQNLDTELNNLRTFMFEQISARFIEVTGTVKSDVMEKIRDEIEKVRAESTAIKLDIQNTVIESGKKIEKTERETVEQLQVQIKTIQETARASEENIGKSEQETLDQIKKMQSSLEAILAQYPWLAKSELREGLSKLSDIPSVEKAHALATELTEKRDEDAALAVLHAIVEENLPGDKADFHNSYSQCMRLDNPILALKILEAGLKLFPDDYDLMADKAQALNALGRPLEAQKILEDWMERKPDEFARGWRPVVFYAKVVEAGTLDNEAVEKLITTFESVVSHAPYEQKVWSAYGRFLEKLGRIPEAEDILLRGIEYNPFSQELNYVLGELYLRTGDAENAVAKLEIAAKRDYQSQYQHDINQHSVLCTLAQAYEAADEPERAVKLYQSLLKRQGVMGQIRSYAQQRLQMLDALGDEPIDILESASPLAQLANLLEAQKAHHEDGEAKLPGEHHEDGESENGRNEDSGGEDGKK